MTANHYSLTMQPCRKAGIGHQCSDNSQQKNTSLGDRLQEATNSQVEEDQTNRLSKIKIMLENSLQESQEKSENEKGQHAEVEKTKPWDTAQKKPNPLKSDSDTKGITLEDQTGKKMERRKKASYRDSESGKKAFDKRKEPYHEDESW